MSSVPAEYRDYIPRNATRKRHPITERDSDITTSDNGGGNVSYEEILDLSPPADVLYEIRDSAGLKITALSLDDSGDTELTDDAQLKWVVSDPQDDDWVTVSREYDYGEFANRDLLNAEEEMEIDFQESDLDVVYIPRDHHLKLVMKHDTDVDWSKADTQIRWEIIEHS